MPVYNGEMNPTDPDPYPLLDPTPTSAVPGSEEKIKVLGERWVRGEKLYHPLDMTLERCYEEQYHSSVLRQVERVRASLIRLCSNNEGDEGVLGDK